MKISLSWIGACGLLAARMAGLLLFCAPVAAGSLFDALEITPADFAPTRNLPSAQSFACLPSTAEERVALIEVLRETPDGPGRQSRIAYAAQLFEVWGMHAKALEFLQTEGNEKPDPMQLARLRYHTGDLDGARDAFAVSQLIPPHRIQERDTVQRVRSSVNTFVADGRIAELEAFLAWMQPQCRFGEWRSAVLAERINLALHNSTLDGLLAELSRESPVARTVADQMLEPVGAPATPEGTHSVLDLAWLVGRHGKYALDMRLTRMLEDVIRSGEGSEEDRAELFRQIVLRSWFDATRLHLLELWVGRGDETVGLFLLSGPATHYIPGLPHEALTGLAERHLDNAAFNFLAGFNVVSGYSGTRACPLTRSALDCLERAWRAAPLHAGRPMPPPIPMHLIAAGPSRILWWQDDPGRYALEKLVGYYTADELHDLVFSRDDFRSLPLPGRLRYLEAAGLDVVFLDEIFATDWSLPENDTHGGGVSFPNTGNRVAPPEVLERFHDLLPAILLGSTEKTAEMVAAHSVRPLALLFGHKWTPPSASQRVMLRRWHDALMVRGPDFAARVMAEGPRFRGGEPDLGLIR